MASQVYTKTPKVRFINEGAAATFYLDPLDDIAVTALNAFFAAHGSKTTATITQEASNRGGYGLDGPSYVVKIVMS